MDKFLDKFGIYDFMGVWGPGTLTVTYYLFSLKLFFNFMQVQFEKRNFFTQSQLLIVLYTAVSYSTGIILHEMGKLVFDAFEAFQTEKFCQHITKAYCIGKKRWFTPFKNIKFDVCTAFNQCGIREKLKDNKNNGFENAICSLKYNDKTDTRRIDTYHSVYALSRSLCLCFMGNLFFLILETIAFNRELNLWLVFADALFIVLFSIRTYRYFYVWVKNVYLQFYIQFDRKPSC